MVKLLYLIPLINTSNTINKYDLSLVGRRIVATGRFDFPDNSEDAHALFSQIKALKSPSPVPGRRKSPGRAALLLNRSQISFRGPH